MSGLAAEFSIVERGDTVVLEGYPDESESEWRVNSAEHFSKGSTRRVAVILQANGGGEHWLTISMERTGGDWIIDDFVAFEGAAPKGNAGDEAIPIDPNEIEFIELR